MRLNITYIHLLICPRLLLHGPPGLLEEVLKVVAVDSDAGLGALAHVVDRLLHLFRIHPPGKTVDGGPQLSHRGRQMPPELHQTHSPEPETQWREVRRYG